MPLRACAAAVLFATLCSAAYGAPPRLRAMQPPLAIGGDRHLLWIGAHPDDEVLVAPLLESACVRNGARCSILVMTRGEGGDCLLPGGCSPDLLTVRSGEMIRAAARFRASLIQWELPDVMQSVGAAWDEEATVERLTTIFRESAPSLVITFDPMHGSSCHPAHRESGRLVLAAVARLGAAAPRVLLVETTIARNGSDFTFTPALSDPNLQRFDAASFWQALPDDAAIHASQFTPEQIASLERQPSEQRVIWLLPAERSAAAAYRLRCE